jgi:putative phosphoesterase
MKILVFSDSHGNSQQMIKALSQHINETDYIIHLGDHCTDVRYIENISGITPVLAVVGNNDHNMAKNEYPEEKIIEIGGINFLLTHGHKQGVKQGINVLIALAKGKKCNVALFGHTHIPYCGKENDLYILNPGSIGYPSAKGYTYGIITIENNNINMEICEV